MAKATPGAFGSCLLLGPLEPVVLCLQRSAKQKEWQEDGRRAVSSPLPSDSPLVLLLSVLHGFPLLPWELGLG